MMTQRSKQDERSLPLDLDAEAPDVRSSWSKVSSAKLLIFCALIAGILVSVLAALRPSPQPPSSAATTKPLRHSVWEGPYLATVFDPPSADWLNASAQMQIQLLPHLVELGPPQPGDWLSSHPEKGQSFAEYLSANPIRPTPLRHKIYILPIGPFSETQWYILERSAAFLSHYFRLPVKMLPSRSLRSLPPRSGRDHMGDFQLHTGTILSRVLYPELPPDAAVFLGFTAVDLYPQENWNFVFGEATFDARVGVWSLARFGNPDFGKEFFHKVLRRTFSTATHETGHMFGMAHCTKHHCNMNGVNSLEEADRAPLSLCAECLSKLTWLTAADAQAWLQDIEAFLRDEGLSEEAEPFAVQARAVGESHNDAAEKEGARDSVLHGTGHSPASRLLIPKARSQQSFQPAHEHL